MVKLILQQIRFFNLRRKIDWHFYTKPFWNQSSWLASVIIWIPSDQASFALSTMKEFAREKSLHTQKYIPLYENVDYFLLANIDARDINFVNVKSFWFEKQWFFLASLLYQCQMWLATNIWREIRLGFCIIGHHLNKKVCL